MLNYSVYLNHKNTIFNKIFDKNLLFISTKTIIKPKGKKLINNYIRNTSRVMLFDISNYNHFINNKFNNVNFSAKLFFFKKYSKFTIVLNSFYLNQQLINNNNFYKRHLKYSSLADNLINKFKTFQLLLSFNKASNKLSSKTYSNMKPKKIRYNNYIFNKFFYKLYKKKTFIRQRKSFLEKKNLHLINFFLKNYKGYRYVTAKVKNYNMKLRRVFLKFKNFKTPKYIFTKPRVYRCFPYLIN